MALTRIQVAQTGFWWVSSTKSTSALANPGNQRAGVYAGGEGGLVRAEPEENSEEGLLHFYLAANTIHVPVVIFFAIR